MQEACTLTIDKDCEGRQCDVGLVPAVLEKVNPDPKDTTAILCGPPIMIKFTLMSFGKAGLTPRADLYDPGEAHEVRYRDLQAV